MCDTAKIKTRVSKRFEQTKIKSVTHWAGGQSFVKVDDKTKAEGIVANWLADVFGAAQCCVDIQGNHKTTKLT